MASIELPGNVILPPSYTKGNQSVDEELMYSMKGYTQKGVMLKAGQGTLLLGTVLGQKTGDKLWYKYDDSGVGGVTNEVQSVTEGGSGLTSFTLTFSGQTTASIPASTTSANIKTQLELLSNIADGDITVTGPAGSSNGPWSVTFGGSLADTNVAQMTTTPTGGSGTVTVATTLGGNTADGIDTARGFLRMSVDTGTDVAGSNLMGNLVVMGAVKLSKTNAAGNLDAAAIVDLNGRSDTALGAFFF